MSGCSFLVHKDLTDSHVQLYEIFVQKRVSSEKIFSELLLPSSQCPWCTAKCTISLGKNEIYPISIHRGYDKLHLEPGVNHWPMSTVGHFFAKPLARQPSVGT
jgi:hypothetical protein